MHRCVSGCTLQAYCCNKATCIDAPRRIARDTDGGSSPGRPLAARAAGKGQNAVVPVPARADGLECREKNTRVRRSGIKRAGRAAGVVDRRSLEKCGHDARRLITIEQGVPHGGPRDVSSLPGCGGRAHPSGLAGDEFRRTRGRRGRRVVAIRGGQCRVGERRCGAKVARGRES